MTAEPTPFITVQTGPRNARTDPDTGLRYYSWQGRELPSVTTIRRLAGIPHRLHQWELNQVIRRATEEHPELTRMLTRERRPRERVLEKNRVAEASKWLRSAATEERDVAALLGTAVHDAAAQGMDPDAVEPAIRPRLLQFRHWLQVSGSSVLASEFQCWNLAVGYAGTADLLARMRDGSVYLIDLKTGKSVFSEHALQVIAYSMAEFVGEDGVRNDVLTRLLHGITGMGVLHLADDHWEFRRVRADAETWRAFRGLLAFAVWMTEHVDADSVTTATRKGAYA